MFMVFYASRFPLENFPTFTVEGWKQTELICNEIRFTYLKSTRKLHALRWMEDNGIHTIKLGIIN